MAESIPLAIPEILSTGITGFAFLMLYLGYRLTNSVQSRILDSDPNHFESLEYFKAWEALAQKQIANTRIFMCFSLVFFVTGAILLAYQIIYQPQADIILSVTPIEDNILQPVVSLQQSQIRLDSNGKTRFKIVSEQNISVDNNAMSKKLTELTQKINDNEKSMAKAIAATAEHSNEAGLALH